MLKRMIRKAAQRWPAERRDTDRDWRMIGATEPYFGVLTAEEFKRTNLDDAARSRFFASGRDQVANNLARMRTLFGHFEPRSALDFGCGVGRLTVPLAEITGNATGVDVSPGMLAEARRHTTPGLNFVDALPNGRFDWVMSHIVLQHIPPERGYVLLREMLERVGDGGGATIQVVFARTPLHADSAGARLIHGVDEMFYADTHRRHRIAEGVMLMHDYDLSIVVSLFYSARMHSLHLEHTDHGGMIGAVIYGKKSS